MTARPRLPSDLFPALAAAVVGLAAVWPALLAGELLVGRDLLPQFYPRMELIGAALAEGRVPLWNPLAGHGAPWFGLRTGGVLYPGHLLFAALPSPLAMASYVAVHLALGVEGARRLAARERPGIPAAFGGLAYGLGGFLASQYWALPYLVSGAWLPWALLGAAEVPARPARGGATFALALGMQLLSGEPQGALATTAAGLALAAMAARSSGASAARAALVVSGACGIGAALAGPQVLSMLFELGAVDRAQAGHHADPRWGLAPMGLLLDAVAPGVLGQHSFVEGGYWGAPFWDGQLPWCGVGVGALGLAGAATAVVRARRLGTIGRFGLGLAVAGVLLAASPVSRLLLLRFPAKWLVLTALGLALLAAAGASAWLERRSLRAGAAALLVLLLVTGLGAISSDVWPRALADVDLGPQARKAALDALERAAAMSALGLVALRAAASRRVPRRRAAALLLAVSCLDLLGAARGAIRSTTIDALARPPLPDALAAHGGQLPGVPPRFYPQSGHIDHHVPTLDGLLPEEARELTLQRLLSPNNGYRFGVRYVSPFEAVVDGLRGRLVRDPRFQALSTLEQMARFDVDLLLITAAGVGALDDADRARLRVIGPVTGDRELLLARNLACPEWARCTSEAVVARSIDDVAAALCAADVDLRRRVVLGPEGLPGPTAVEGGASARAAITLRRYEPERVEVDVEAAAPCWLVLREAYDPDWQATVDGRPVTVARADLFFRAVPLPAGRHLVVLTYAPRWWWPGLLLLVGAAVTLGAAPVLERRRDGAALLAPSG